MSQDQQKNMEIIRHWFDTINDNDVAKILKEFAEIATDDYLLHDPSTPNLKAGLAKYLKLFKQQLSGSADRQVTVDDIFALDDKVVFRGEYEFLDVATQKRKKMAAMGISRFEGGKIKEEWQIITPYAVPTNE
jgi:predicted SnoaL-like aldol condensation-catalyzing enzyme